MTPAAQTGRWLALAAGLCALTVPWLLPGYGQQPGARPQGAHRADTGWPSTRSSRCGPG
jgi:hypothetical protein